jgi:hypothetical protein
MTDPKLEKPPTRIYETENINRINKIKRLQLLNEKLRLNNIVDGPDDIRKICEEYVGIF